MYSIISMLLIVLLFVAELPVQAADITVSNPRSVIDSNMESGKKVTWDCIWFGTYPQKEIIDTHSMYNILRNASGWGSNNEIIINGTKYLRLQTSDSLWHFFQYEPIKWRVLQVDGDKMLLLSDVILDAKPYCNEWGYITWEKSTVRSWLNGYNSNENDLGIDYIGNNFKDIAFSESEWNKIVNSNVENADNRKYGIDGGNNTKDKLFLLSLADVNDTTKAMSYGFTMNWDTYDEALKSTYSDYSGYVDNCSLTKLSDDSCNWWLRSPGSGEYYAAYVAWDGTVQLQGQCVNINDYGIRPSLYLPVNGGYTYAGTVCSDDSKNEVNKNEESTDQSTKIPQNGQQNESQIPEKNVSPKKEFVKGQTIIDTEGRYYRVISVSSGKANLEYRGIKNKNKSSVIVPEYFSYNGNIGTVTLIASKAFKGMKKLQTVYIGNTVKKIGNEAFNGCTSLKKVVFGASVSEIGTGAFLKCTKLQSITISSKVTKIGAKAFYGCKNLKKITVKTTRLKSVGTNALKGIHKKAVIKVPKKQYKKYTKLFKNKGQKKTVKVKK